MLASKTIVLTLDKETARSHILDRVKNVRTTRGDSRITIRSNSGVVLAYLSDYELPDGEQGAKLEYRSGASLFMASYGSTARRIRNAVSRYRM